LIQLFSKSADRFSEVEGFRLGASFSYYATFAIFPLLLLTVTVIGFVIGDDAPARERVLSAIASPDPAMRSTVESTLASMQSSRSGRGLSAAIAIFSLLFSASGALVELDFALNKIWCVKPRASKGIVGSIRLFLSERLGGIALVLGIGATLLASLVMSTVLAAVANRAHYKLTPALLQTAELGGSIVLLSLVFATAFHLVPRSRPPFRDVFGGAVLTTVLLTALKEVFASYLSHLTSYSAYGVVGGVLALATWIYLSSQIIFFGATLTRIHCEMTGCPAARARDAHSAGTGLAPADATAE
jgi:membrane protein